MNENEIISFIKSKEYIYIKDLGKGAFGVTVLLKDPITQEFYACKKYSPSFPATTKYFQKFISEIKILNNMLHENIIRIYNSYLYPDKKTGFIIMEYVDGTNILEYLKVNNEKTEDIFEQLINTFVYMESKNICHRDIREGNILVTSNGNVKIIDFGFGKEFLLDCQMTDSTKINTNWICSLPDEMSNNQPIYDNTTDIYFLGNLLLKIIEENKIQFKYTTILKTMCCKNKNGRYKSFKEIYTVITEKDVADILIVGEDSRQIYSTFIDKLSSIINEIAYSANIEEDVDKIIDKLVKLYNENSLEQYIMNNENLVKCFINGNFKYNNVESGWDYEEGDWIRYDMPITVFETFLKWIKACNSNMKSILSKNLINRLDNIKKYIDIDDGELPF